VEVKAALLQSAEGREKRGGFLRALSTRLSELYSDLLPQERERFAALADGGRSKQPGPKRSAPMNPYQVWLAEFRAKPEYHDVKVEVKAALLQSAEGREKRGGFLRALSRRLSELYKDLLPQERERFTALATAKRARNR
jgi:hypothetical protein